MKYIINEFYFLFYFNIGSTPFPILFQQISIEFENSQLNIRKSQLYFRNLNSHCENLNYISEFSIDFQKMSTN